MEAKLSVALVLSLVPLPKFLMVFKIFQWRGPFKYGFALSQNLCHYINPAIQAIHLYLQTRTLKLGPLAIVGTILQLGRFHS